MNQGECHREYVRTGSVMSSDEAKCLKQVNTGTGSTNCQLEKGHGGYCSQHAIAMRPRENCLELEPIKDRLASIRANPPIRWGRHDAVAMIEQDIPALINEVEQCRIAALNLTALVKEASEIMQIVYANNFPAGIESFLTRAHAAVSGIPASSQRAEKEKL